MAEEQLQEAPSVPNPSNVQTPEMRIAEKMRRAAGYEEPVNEPVQTETEVTEEPAPQVEASEAQEEATEVVAESPEPVEADDLPTITSAKEAAEALGVSLEDFYSLSFPITVGEESRDIPLSEIKDSVETKERALQWQQEAQAAREEAQAAKQQAQIEAEHAQEQVRARLAEAMALSDGLDQMYLAPYQQVDWQTLRAEDPAEFSAKYQEYVNIKAAVDAKKQEVASEVEAFKTRTEEQQLAAQQEHLEREKAALRKAWPEMGDETVDPETGKTKGDLVRARLVSELQGRGFTDEEIGGASDSRIMLLARDAMLYREQSERAGAAKKKVVKIGKTVLTPGAAQTKAEAKRGKVDPLRQRLRKTGKVEDFAALLSEKARRN